MSNVRLFDKSFKPFIPNERLEEAIDKVAEKINHDFNGCTDCPVLLCVLNGSLMFTSELMKRLTFNCELVCIKLSSYNGTHTTGNVREVMLLQWPTSWAGPQHEPVVRLRTSHSCSTRNLSRTCQRSRTMYIIELERFPTLWEYQWARS